MFRVYVQGYRFFFVEVDSYTFCLDSNYITKTDLAFEKDSGVKLMSQKLFLCINTYSVGPFGW